MNHRARFVQRATLRRRSVRPVTYLSPRGAILRVLCALLVLVLFAQPALADRPGGVTAQTLSLPTGPASLKGLGESFSPNMATGTGSYSVPISLPPGFVAPSISLNYTGGRGKGVLGQSWSLPTLQIYRQTDKGEPNFTEEDRFSVMGPGMNDELVLVNEELRYYRLKNEGAFALFIRDVAGDSWTIRLPSGQTAYLGESLESKETSRGKAHKWFISRQVDRFSHWTEYHYFTDEGKTYLESIDYQMHADVAYQNHVDFVYEDRPDVFTDYTYGSACTTAQRVAAIEVRHGDRLIRTYELSYKKALLFSQLSGVLMTGEYGLTMPPLSFEYLEESQNSGGLVTMKDAPPLEPLLDGSGELDDVNGDALPDLIVARSGDYHYYENWDGRSFIDRRALKNSPDRTLFEAGVVFVDVNGDGFRDLLHPQAEKFRYYPGGDIEDGIFKGYGEAVELDSSSDGFLFTSQALKLGDQNHDGRIDLLWQKPGADSVLMNGEDDMLREEYVAELPADVDFSDPRVEMTDFNGDGIMDFVLKQIGFESSNMRVWFGIGHGRYLAEQQVLNVPKGDPGNFYLRDINRDGQADLLRVSGSWATYYLNLGDMRFSGKRGDFYGLPSTSDTQKLLFADMNGNGTTDLVWITTDFKLHYLDLTNEPNAGMLYRIDNGMGLVTTMGYRSSTSYRIEAKNENRRWAHPMPSPVGVISEMATTDSLDLIGMTATESLTSYEYRDGYWDTKEREFRGFAEATVTSWGDAYHESLVTRTKMHVGRHPETGADEEILKGKPFFQEQLDDQGGRFSSVETNWEMRHLCQEDLLQAPEQILPNCSSLGDLSDKKDQLISLGVSTEAFTATYEQTQTPRYTATHTDYDVWGNPIRSENYGEVLYSAVYTPGEGFSPSAMNVAFGDDEQITTTERLYELDEWLIGLTTQSDLLDLQGNSWGRTQTFYDGLPQAKANAGLVTKVSRWFEDESRWIDQELNTYDSHGNKTSTVNAVGDRVELKYESDSNLLPSEERVLVGGGKWVTFTAQYDHGYGAIISSIDPNGHTWGMTLDGLGRVTELYDPLSAAGEPVSIFDYEYGTSDYPVSTTTVSQLQVRASQSDSNEARYHSSISFSDGAGRTRQQKETANEAGYGYVASAWTQLSSRGKPI
ncbi:MAG: FG-GAP-like repeat-containing protein, partial [Polyangiaceae bacterium]|nr:FG-GAP-like repeat-containing protein [Polyangiaceae bacterium]